MTQTAVSPPWQRAREAATTDATRHLCAGAYLDREFRDTVISQVRHDCQHRAAPSYGFDLTAVAHHAWRAWLLETGGQALTAAILITALLLAPGTVITAACGAGIWILGRRALRDLREMMMLRARSAHARWLRRPERAADQGRRRELSRWMAVQGGGCVVLVETGGLAASSRGPLTDGILSTVLLLALMLGVSAVSAAAHQQAINWVGDAESLRPARLRGRLEVIAQQESSAWVVYRRPRPQARSCPTFRFPPTGPAPHEQPQPPAPGDVRQGPRVLNCRHGRKAERRPRRRPADPVHTAGRPRGAVSPQASRAARPQGGRDLGLDRR